MNPIINSAIDLDQPVSNLLKATIFSRPWDMGINWLSTSSTKE